MKLSIAWIFDHIQADWKHQDIPALIARLGATTAEIDQVKEVIIDFDAFSLAQVTKSSQEGVTLYSPEWKKEYTIAPVKGQSYTKDQWFLIIKDNKNYRFATMIDVGSEKEGVLPAVACAQELVTGGWKQQVDRYDYIITLDNKAITHRPDLWGHRGFAREIAAIMAVPLRAEEIFLADKPIKHFDHAATPTEHNPLQVRIESKTCKRLAGLYISKIEYHASSLLSALRLARIDARPIDALVDATNYTMYDWGQPMHAFDAAKIHQCTLIAQQARAGEKLTLLDGETIQLTPDDCIISDGHKALALAGIMGGLDSGVSKTTQSLIIEAANFDATDIRLTAARYKRRTEASSRFEKTLDPQQNTHALLRFLKLLDTEKIAYQAADAIRSLGSLAPEKTLTVRHDTIQQKLGIILDEQKVTRILQALGFGVQYDKQAGMYTLIVPSFRATKDVAIQEDIIEEIGRSIGYNTIPPKSPLRAMNPIDHSARMALRTVKQQCAYGLHMHEVYNYAFYDEEFMRHVNLAIDSVAIVNPVSENWQRLVTSLIPHLLKNVQTAAIGIDELRFFETGTIWDKHVHEKQTIGLVFYNKKGFSFYDGKALLQQIFDALQITVQYRKAHQPAPWFDQYQTAEIVLNDQVIGHAGMLDAQLALRIAEGALFVAELDLASLLQGNMTKKRFKALAKYQPVALDISMLLPYTITADAITLTIANVDERIHEVRIVDFFEKPEWRDHRSVTVRFVITDEHKTLTKEDIDAVNSTVVRAVTTVGAQVR